MRGRLSARLGCAVTTCCGHVFRSLWSPHLKALVSLMLETDNGDLLVEVLGTLGCLTPLDLPLGTSWTALLYVS